MSDETFEVTLEQTDRYCFTADFHRPGISPLTLDEPPPLGGEQGPGASRLLAAAVGHCLSASALFCLEKARVKVLGMRTTVTADVVRNDRGRLRVGGLSVKLQPRVSAADRSRLGRCLELFEDYCIVTQSVRRGIPVSVVVEADTSTDSGPESG